MKTLLVAVWSTVVVLGFDSEKIMAGGEPCPAGATCAEQPEKTPMSPLSDKQVIAIAEDGARDRGLSVQGLVAFAVLRGQVWEVNFVPAGVNVLGGGVKVMIRASDGAVLDAHISP